MTSQEDRYLEDLHFPKHGGVAEDDPIYQSYGAQFVTGLFEPDPGESEAIVITKEQFWRAIIALADGLGIRLK